MLLGEIEPKEAKRGFGGRNWGDGRVVKKGGGRLREVVVAETGRWSSKGDIVGRNRAVAVQGR